MSPDPAPAAETRGWGPSKPPTLQRVDPSPRQQPGSAQGHKGQPEGCHTSRVPITKIPVCIYSPNYAVQSTGAKSVTNADSKAALLAELGRGAAPAPVPGAERFWQRPSPALPADGAESCPGQVCIKHWSVLPAQPRGAGRAPRGPSRPHTRAAGTPRFCGTCPELGRESKHCDNPHRRGKTREIGTKWGNSAHYANARPTGSSRD